MLYNEWIGVHELRGLVDPNQGQVTNLFAIDPLSLFDYIPHS